MMKKALSEKNFPKALLTLAVLMLFNPNVNILDPLPDFIGHLIIAGSLRHAARRVPFFEEARLGFLKLALISAAKYPAFLLMVMIRGGNTLDNDVITLFSFSFAVVEVIFTVKAVNDLFAGISYLGARTGAESIIGKNPTADKLKSFTLFFSVLKCALYALPEFLLLTTTVDAGSPTTMMPEARFYPVVLLGSQLIGYAVGLAWAAFFIRYLKGVSDSGEFYPAVMKFTDEKKEVEIERKIKLDRVLSALKLLPWGALLTFEFTLDKFNNTNILPAFISGFLILAAIKRLSTFKTSVLDLCLLFSGLVYSLFSLAVWFVSIHYHDNYSHAEIALYKEADAMFNVYALLSIAETLLFTVFIVFAFLVIKRFIRTHTGKTPKGVSDPLSDTESDGEYSRHDKRYHRSLTVRAGIFAAFGVISALARLLYVFTDNERTFNSGTLIPNVAPWLGAAIAGISVVWFVYSLYFTGMLADDFKIKYSDSKIQNEPHESQYF